MEQALNRLRQAGEEMKRSASSGTAPQQNQDAARRAADQLRQATNLLGGAQQQQSTGRLASLAGESDRLSKEEHAQAERIHTLANDARSGQDKSLTQEEYDARIQERDNLAEERQRLSDDLSQLEKGMRDTARELAPIQPGTASKLRDALNGMDQNDLTNRVQRTADWLRRGIDPNSNGTEGDIATDLQHLSDQVRQAQQSMGAEKPGQNAAQGQQIAALDHLERLRNQIQSQMRSQNQNQNAGQQGSSNNQQAQNGQPGQRGQNGQQAQGQNLGRQAGNGQGQNARGGDVGNRASGDVGNTVSGDIGNRGSGGGGEGAVWGNINTGNNHFGPRGQNSAAPETIPPPAVTERAYQNDLTELNQLRHLAQSDPAALKQVQELIRAMQQLDPHRFTGNPALVEQLHTQVLNDVDKLELQLRHDADDQSQGEVRTGKSSYVPPSYQDAVADYYRRLSNSGK